MGWNLEWNRKCNGLEVIEAVRMTNLIVFQVSHRVVAHCPGPVQQGDSAVLVDLISMDMTMENVANPKGFEQPQRFRPAPHSHGI